MDINGLTQLISQFGFPIVMCGAFFWYIVKKDTLHKDESERFANALENNTIVLNRILERLGEDSAGS